MISNICTFFPIASCSDWRWDQLFRSCNGLSVPDTTRNVHFAVRRRPCIVRLDNRHRAALLPLFLWGTFTQGSRPRETRFIRFDSITSISTIADWLLYVDSTCALLFVIEDRFDQSLPFLRDFIIATSLNLFPLKKNLLYHVISNRVFILLISDIRFYLLSTKRNEVRLPPAEINDSPPWILTLRLTITPFFTSSSAIAGLYFGNVY